MAADALAYLTEWRIRLAQREVLQAPSVLAPPRVLLAAMLAALACTCLLLWVLHPRGVLAALSGVTHGLIPGSQLVNLASCGCVVGGVLVGWGRLGARELGLQWRELAAASGTTLLLWLLIQPLAAAIRLAAGEPLVIAAQWSDPGVGPVLGRFIGQLFGNALYEEVLYRAVLLRQLYWHFTRAAGPSVRCLTKAVAVSSLAFAAMHGVAFSILGADVLLPMLNVFCAGCVFAWLYLETGQLLLVIGAHALANTPTLLVEDPFGYDNLLWLCVLCVAARLLARRGRH